MYLNLTENIKMLDLLPNYCLNPFPPIDLTKNITVLFLEDKYKFIT